MRYSWLLLALTAFAGATQDIVVDAYRIEIAPLEQQATLAATYSLGYRIGLIAGGAGALYVAEFWGWRTAYLCDGAAGIAGHADRDAAGARTGADRAVRAPALLAFVVGPFVAVLPATAGVLALALLAFVGMYKLPDQMLGVFAGPFYIDTGFSKADIANVSKVVRRVDRHRWAPFGGSRLPVSAWEFSQPAAGGTGGGAVELALHPDGTASGRDVGVRASRSPATTSARASPAPCWWRSCRRSLTAASPPPSTRCSAHWPICRAS